MPQYEDYDDILQATANDGSDQSVIESSDGDYDDEYGNDDGEYNEDYDDIIYRDNDIVPMRWASLVIGETELKVFNTGAIQYPDSIFNVTYGTNVPGTAYRSVAIRLEQDVYDNFYMHEIVWMAFHGNIPPGWVVGHKCLEINPDTKCYDNALENLDIYFNTVGLLPYDNALKHIVY